MSCVKPYEPPEIQGPNAYLVVEGVINANSNGVSNFSLSFTRPLNDTVINNPVLNAILMIESASGGTYPLNSIGNGNYASNALTLDQSDNYRLRIILNGNNNYISQFVPVVKTGPIDSLHWIEQDQKIFIYVDAHDPLNNTKYYRWNFIETWEYRSFYDSFLEFKNGVVVYRDSADQTTYCWDEEISTNLLLQTTVQLSEDRVKDFLVTTLPSASYKLQEKYSIEVKQFGFTKEAYEYWKILQRNTEQLGGIFDAQPSQLIGNIYNELNADEPVIGFVSASTIQESRIFIRRSQIIDRFQPASDCQVITTSSDSAAYYLADPQLAPAYYVSGGGIAISTWDCVDCRLRGGTTSRPLFWQ